MVSNKFVILSILSPWVSDGAPGVGITCSYSVSESLSIFAPSSESSNISVSLADPAVHVGGSENVKFNGN